MLLKLIEERSTTKDYFVFLAANKVDLIEEWKHDEEQAMLSIIENDESLSYLDRLTYERISVKAEIGLTELST